jgi:hypothetical protein
MNIKAAAWPGDSLQNAIIVLLFAPSGFAPASRVRAE